MTDIGIIGGGASGLFAAITALTYGNNVRVTVFEQLNRVGKKILATGNGRCNITNEFADKEINKNNCVKPAYYHGEKPQFALYALKNFNQKKLVEFFTANGLLLRKEKDKYYPFSEQAGTVLDFLRLKCEILGADIITDTKVDKIDFKNNKFIINNQFFDKVIVACGGKSSPHLGSDGSGYKLLELFGHKTTPLYPAITQIKTETEFVKQLKGIKSDANCKIIINDKIVREEFGQVLFADYGLSGPPIFQLSLIAAQNYKKNCFISLDFMSEKSKNDVFSLIKSVFESPFTYPLTCEILLSLFLNKRLGQVIIKSCGFKLNKDAYELTEKQIMQIAEAIKDFRIKVKGVNGFQNAQVTAGGVSTIDFDEKTMESKLQKGLFACGEILDICGDCGGFNLQWAFSSGYLAAINAIGE